jgi:hypothetical protein
VLEAVVTDFIVFLVREYPPSRTASALRKLRGSLLDFIDMDADQQARLIVELLATELNARRTPGVGRFEDLLNAVGMGGPVDDDVKRALVELSEARHAIIHRQEKVDKRFLDRCPWYGATEGEKLRTKERVFHKYALAARWYAFELSRRWIETKPEGREVGPTGMQQLSVCAPPSR